MRALTTQVTSGSTGTSFGCFEPQPSFVVLSTGTEGAPRQCAGVEVPGVSGGVKAGDRRAGTWSGSGVCEIFRCEGLTDAYAFSCLGDGD